MVTGAVGVAAYEALRKMVVKAPLRAATVSVATGFNVDAVRAVAIEETVSQVTGVHAVHAYPRTASVVICLTAGTNTAETRSASRCTGALSPCACSTSRTICASAVSAPTAVARTVNSPSRRRRRVDAHRRIRPGREDGG